MTGNPQLLDVDLSDKFEIDEGRILISGTQALARLPLVQRQLDQNMGLNTRGFISGYRGSPLGMLDNTLWREKKRMDEAGVVFQPGVNEDLAATAVWGSQQLDFFPEPLVDGVYAMWYGKAPGVDRSADAMRHGNSFGTHKHGGVLLAVGDDHPGKSSSIVNQSEPLLAALKIPVLYPSNVQEIMDFGLLGWQLSRYCGLWVGLKTVNETVEQTQTVSVDTDAFSVELPDRGLDAHNVNIRQSAFNPQAMDVTVERVRLPLVHKFVRANRIDQEQIGGRGGLGIVTSGKSYSDVIQALGILGLDEAAAKELGLSIYKVGCVWPLEPQGLCDFAEGREELLFVEEKSAMLEPQAAQVLINAERSPRLVGKTDAKGITLLPSDVQLEPALIADVIVARLQAQGVEQAKINAIYNAVSQSPVQSCAATSAASVKRTPYFCSGCPHNTSTRVPEGSLAMAGIGCHSMAMFTRSDTLLPVHMGGEGMNWVGASAFSGTQHMFQNLGDGTYFHSGLMAIRAAVASGVNITYKILYNDAVAMTGGQPVDGPISVPEMARQLAAEGVVEIRLVSDDPDRFRGDLPTDVLRHPREELHRVQRQLREVSGTTVLIYEQTCAAEKRRRRKRGTYPDPQKRLFINSAVCEGCGDCSEQSTCVSIQPNKTEFGAKRQIDQSSCNKDYSCVQGFCPSFVTVLNAEPKKPSGVALDSGLFDDLPVPSTASIDQGNMGVMIAGIGGTGVITVGAVLGMAAHLENKACSIYDMTGLSQKNGAVYSHLRIANKAENLAAQRIGVGEADLVLGFDMVAALSGDADPTYASGRTRFVGNSDVVPTVDFQFDRDARIAVGELEASVVARTDHGSAYFINATQMASRLCGDSIAANMYLVGYAAQQGLVPVTVTALERAIELNGTAVQFNLTAFRLGRLYAHSPDVVMSLLPEEQAEASASTLEEQIEIRAAQLRDYQNEAWADRYLEWVARIKRAEVALDSEAAELTTAVAINLAKLMSYKDEYEVARLYSDPAFRKALDQQFEPGYTLKFNLAPPLISRRNPSSGLLMKREFGGWMMAGFKVLARLKGLRGTALDIFGYTAERRMERGLISEYESMLNTLIEGLSADNKSTAIVLATLPDSIRGFGHVKDGSVALYSARKSELLAAFTA
ncbi:MAG: indolepyruvate ferredoxin oxidoreductase family protein [Halieaceae bacterium]